jgi:hypothetical protein
MEILGLGSHRDLVQRFMNQLNKILFPGAIRDLGLILLAALACYTILELFRNKR